MDNRYCGIYFALFRCAQQSQYRELYTRWFEFGTFCPILHTHGHRTANELFSYGPQTPTLIDYDKLRSRLLPYTYSLAWRVTQDDYTLMRPLVMDWRKEEKVRHIDDQFMFGPSLLINPVTIAGATQRLLYLPSAPAWYDFWTGEKTTGDQQILAKAPLGLIPIYVPAGAILPLGPANEYVDQHPGEPIELRISPGANGSFTLYDDEGDGYRYEKGEHAAITLQWDDATKTLSFGRRQGQYTGMQQRRIFHVTLVAPNVGTGFTAHNSAPLPILARLSEAVTELSCGEVQGRSREGGVFVCVDVLCSSCSEFAGPFQAAEGVDHAFEVVGHDSEADFGVCASKAAK